MTDGDLVRRAREGDSDSLCALVQLWSARVLAFCLVRCRNRHLAEDLAQESLLRALRNLGALENPDRFGPWIRGIALRAYLDWRKARQSSQVPFSTLDSDEMIDTLLAGDIDSTVERDDDLNWLMRQVATLDEDLREALMLYYSHDMTYVELAEILEVSPATINLRLTRARTILRSRASHDDESSRAFTNGTMSAKQSDIADTNSHQVTQKNVSIVEESDLCPMKSAERRQP